MKTLVAPEGYGADKAVPKAAIMLTETLDPEYKSYGRYWHLKANVVEIADDDTPRNMLSDRQPLAGFAVTCQMDGKTANGQPYAIGVKVVVDYLCTMELDAQDVARLHQTYRTIQSRMDKIEATYGRTNDLAAFVLRFADAVGVNRFIVQTAHGADGNYSSGRYQFFSPADAALHIGWAIEKAQQALRPKEEATA